MDNLTIRKKLGVVFTLLILVFLGASVYAAIRKKLGVVFTLLILVFFGASVYAVLSLKNINDGAMRIATTHLHSVLAASDNGAAMTEYRALEYAIVTAPTLKSRAYSEKKAAKLGDQIDITFDAMEKNMEGRSDANLKSLREQWKSYREQLKKIADLADNRKSREAVVMPLTSSRMSFAGFLTRPPFAP